MEIKNEEGKDKTDEELAGLVSANPDFYYFLMERYEEKILRYIRRISGATLETAEDLGQEIFLKAYENIEDFDQSLKFSSWLYRIARNHVISFWRKNRERKTVFSLDDNENLKNILESELDITKEIDGEMLSRKLGEILEFIRPDYREVLILRYFEDKDYQEISDILRRPIGTVGTLLKRAKKELEKEIKRSDIQV